MYNKTSKSNPQLKKSRGAVCHYTLGCISGTVNAHTSGDKLFYTVKVKLFGGMTVSAFVTAPDISDGTYVGVKITTRAEGPSYNVFTLNDDTTRMIVRAAEFCKEDTESTNVTKVTDYVSIDNVIPDTTSVDIQDETWLCAGDDELPF